MFNQASDIDRQGMLQGATAFEKADLFGRLSMQDQIDGALGRMSMTRADFGRMQMKDQSLALLGVSAVQKQSMLGKANLAEAHSMLGRMSVSNWSNLLGRMDMQEKADSFGRVNKKIQLNTLGRAANIQAAMLERASAKTVDNVLGRAFMTSALAK